MKPKHYANQALSLLLHGHQTEAILSLGCCLAAHAEEEERQTKATASLIPDAAMWQEGEKE